MDLLKIGLKIKLLLLLLSFSTLTHAGSCLMGAYIKGTTGIIKLSIDPRVAVGEVLAYRYSKSFAGKTLAIACTGSSPYRSSSVLTASTTVADAYETGIPGVGVIIGDLYKNGMGLPYSTSLSASFLTPWTNQNEVRLTFVKTGAITPGTVGSKLYANFYLNSKVFANLTVNSLTVVQKSCLADVNSQLQTINLGSPNRNEFTGIGSTSASSERNFSVILQCEANDTPVQVTFDAVGSTAGTGMLAINNDTGAATGIAVEVLDENRTPIRFGTATTKHAHAEQRIEIPLTARYKQTGTIKPGTADAAMTFTITQN
ncbi:type 1 fimbrial protein [Erwiniaceae bacterium CMYE1]|nr:type 1 fimbrial protein [Erwinia phyllosphaerae]